MGAEKKAAAVLIYYVKAWRIAQADVFPEWSPDSEFKARRDKMLGR